MTWLKSPKVEGNELSWLTEEGSLTERLEKAKTIADQLLEDYPEASHLHLKRWLSHANERVKV